MATRMARAAAGLYDEDFYGWSQHQAELLRSSRFAELDLGHLSEEVEDLGSTRSSASGYRDRHATGVAVAESSTLGRRLSRPKAR